MTDRRTYRFGEIGMEAFVSDLSKVCYLLMPGGLREEVAQWAAAAADGYSRTIIIVNGIDWNDDLTPWPAPGVFRKAKPFGGKADSFLEILLNEYVPVVEADLASRGLGEVHGRTLAGISLSGLFAIWAAHRTGAFTDIVSISGSLWYDGFAGWVSDSHIDPGVKSVYISLGDREKNSKDPRMKTVEECTELIARHLSDGEGAPSVTYVLEPGVTHFSPVIPRLQAALDQLMAREILESEIEG